MTISSAFARVTGTARRPGTTSIASLPLTLTLLPLAGLLLGLPLERGAIG